MCTGRLNLEVADAATAEDKNSVLFGDLNLPDIEWEQGTTRGKAA
jgi:hypothetical protein